MRRWSRIFLGVAVVCIAIGFATLALSNALPTSWQDQTVFIGAALVVPAPVIFALLAAVTEATGRS
jgi:hypothetical protein